MKKPIHFVSIERENTMERKTKVIGLSVILLTIIGLLCLQSSQAENPIIIRQANLPSITNLPHIDPVVGTLDKPEVFIDKSGVLPQIDQKINTVIIPGVFSDGSGEVFGSGAVEVFGSGSIESPFTGHAMDPLNPQTTGSSMEDFLKSVTGRDSLHGSVCPWK